MAALYAWDSRVSASVTNFAYRGQPAWLLESSGGASAIVAQHGGQLLSWQPANSGECLFLSDKAKFGPGQAIRGGVPLVFPQFAARGPLPRHGMVRSRSWQMSETRFDEGTAMLSLVADISPTPDWPHAVRLEWTVLLDDERMDLELAVENRGASPLSFTAALHSYFLVDDLEDVRLTGLRGTRFEEDGAWHDETGDVVRVDEPLDRIYAKVSGPVLLQTADRSLGIHSDGWPDLVVWNPGEAKAAALDDLAPGDWQRFVCVEAAAVHEPIALPAGDLWSARHSWLDLSGASE